MSNGIKVVFAVGPAVLVALFFIDAAGNARVFLGH